MSPEGISAVLITHNRRGWLLEALTHLARSGAPLDECLVVDNASTDGTAPAVRARFPGVRLLVSTENLGVARARNLGAERARYDLVLFLDDDGVLEPEGLLPLAVELRSRPRLAAVGLTVVEVGRPQLSPLLPGGGRAPSEASAGRQTIPPAQGISIEPAWTFRGGAVLFKREVFEAVGGYSETFFYSHEEDDLVLRLWRHGYRVAISPAVRFRHFGDLNGQLSRKERLYSYYRNRQRVIWRHLPWPDVLLESLACTSGGLARTLGTPDAGAWLCGVARGTLEGLRERSAPLSRAAYRAFRHLDGEAFSYGTRLRRLLRQLRSGRRRLA